MPKEIIRLFIITACKIEKFANHASKTFLNHLLFLPSMADIAIIGAGPAGCACAYLLARAGFKVDVFEEHKAVGKPVQCTGITTAALLDVLEGMGLSLGSQKQGGRHSTSDKTTLPRFIINQVNYAHIYAQNKSSITVRLGRANLVLDRAGFDRFLKKQAADAGARFHMNTRFVGFRKTDHRETGQVKTRLFEIDLIKSSTRAKKRRGEHQQHRADILIGADGPSSAVARAAGMYGSRHFMLGYQLRLRLSNDNSVKFYPFPKGYAWLVPENTNTVRFGIACYTKPREQLELIAREQLKKSPEQLSKITINAQAGLIPIYNQNIRTEQCNIYLLGDAAAQVKATTGGGIVQGLIAAKSLAEALSKRKSYTRLWKKAIGKELALSLLIRNALDSMHAGDYNRLIALLSSKHAQAVLSKYDRDFPSQLLPRLMITEPGMILFSCRVGLRLVGRVVLRR